MSKAYLFGLSLVLAAGTVQAGEGERILRYIAYSNGTALDTETGLLWMRCSVGSTWNGNTCSDGAKKFSWRKRHQTANFAGHSDWRIPTIDELSTIVHCSSGDPEFFRNGRDFARCRGDSEKPTIVHAVFPNTPQLGFWSGTGEWSVNFGIGQDIDYYVWSLDEPAYYVRLVRGGQPGSP